MDIDGLKTDNNYIIGRFALFPLCPIARFSGPPDCILDLIIKKICGNVAKTIVNNAVL